MGVLNSLPARYRVIIDRDACIGCEVAENHCPEIFMLSDGDGKCRVKPRYEARTNDAVSIGIIPESLLRCAEEAVEACPVSAIVIEPS